MEGRQRWSFTDDYKRQAVDLVASSGRSIGSVAKELGLRDSVLRCWVELRGAGSLNDLFRPGFSAASRYSGATALGSTSFWATLWVAKIGSTANTKRNKKGLKLGSTNDSGSHSVRKT
jgi:hypothetical protein